MKRIFWINLSLVNLAIVALLGFGLRSKILFPIPSINFRSLLSAHSHFAFAGWVGLALMTMLIYDLLPKEKAQRKIYQWILAGIEISSLGMVATFPFFGYNAFSIFFSTLYIVAAMVFFPVFIADLWRSRLHKTVRLLGIAAIFSLVLSFLGTIGLTYIITTGSANSNLYRDSIYTFLHFQYNGFFTLAIFSLIFNYLGKKGIEPGHSGHRFALYLCLSVIPALFLSLLWHNSILMYILAGIGCLFILISLGYGITFIRSIKTPLIASKMSNTFLTFALYSFLLKMVLNIGTIIPQLGNAVYGDRPIIIGFLHLVFLGFVTFYILAILIENGYFDRDGKTVFAPFIIFAAGIFANEILLMLQGLGILFEVNSQSYLWLLWVASIILFIGATYIAIARFTVGNKKRP